MTSMYRSAAIAHGTGPELLVDQTIVVDNGRIAWIGHDDEAPDTDGSSLLVDASGATAVPGMVDAHSHTVLQGGAHWIDRIDDPTDRLLDTAEHNGDISYRAGIRWLRDVGAPTRNGRAVSLDVRDSWRGRTDRPSIRAAGAWVEREGLFGFTIAVDDTDDIEKAVLDQISAGSDLIKLYIEGPDKDTSTWAVSEVERAVRTAADAGIPVTAHATNLPSIRAAVSGGVACVEHGTHLDDELARDMARRGTYLVPTLAVGASWKTFGSTTTIDRFTGPESVGRLQERKELSYHSVRLAINAGVTIAAGTDFGGGSTRANHLAWEVECLVDAGLEPWRALAAATWIGGDLLSEPDAGRLRVGGPADFFLVHGNPLDDPTALWRVWRN
jgi:imidazolonepropionase-like amidohydrolase